MRAPTALSLPFVSDKAPAPSAIDRAASLGFRAVALDSASQGLRPRDLDRSARRGLAAHLRRRELHLAGLELFIPPDHLADPARSDRAASALLDALSLLAELADLTPATRALSSALPERIAPDLLAAIASHAGRLGLRLADHRWPPRDPDPDAPALAVGIDPSSIAPHGPLEPALLRAAGRVVAARWRPGPGTPHPDAYTLALVAAGHLAHVVIDVRSQPDPWRAADAALHAWTPGPPAETR